MALLCICVACADYTYCLSFSGKHLSMLPVEPKLGKMLIFGAIFNCLDPIITIVSGLSVRDPFLTPFDKKDVSICLLDTPIFVCLFYGALLFSSFSPFLFASVSDVTFVHAAC